MAVMGAGLDTTATAEGWQLLGGRGRSGREVAGTARLVGEHPHEVRVADCEGPVLWLGAGDRLAGCLAVACAVVAGRAGDADREGSGGRKAGVVEVGFWH